LLRTITPADGDDLVVVRQSDTLDDDIYSENCRFERHVEMFLKHRVEAHALF
jgi:hypothetical protein